MAVWWSAVRRVARGGGRLAVALTVGLAVGGAGCSVHRSGGPAGVYHQVKPGENLYRIGLQYGVTWMAIMEANGLASSTIYSGQTLTIPVAEKAKARKIAIATEGRQTELTTTTSS